MRRKNWQLNQHVLFLRYATGQKGFFPISHLPDNSAYSSLRSNPWLLHVHPHCIFVQIMSIIHPKIISRKKVHKRSDQRGDLPSPLPCVDPSTVLIPSQTMPNPPIHPPSILHHSSQATHNTIFDQIWTSSHLFAFLDFTFIPNSNAWVVVSWLFEKHNCQRDGCTDKRENPGSCYMSTRCLSNWVVKSFKEHLLNEGCYL